MFVLIASLRKCTRIMTQPGTQEPNDNPAQQGYPAAAEPAGVAAVAEKPKKSKKAKLLSILIVVVLACAAVGVRMWMKGNSKERAIEKSVEMPLEENKLPQDVDQVTTWTDLKADGKTIVFTYEIADDAAEQFKADEANKATMSDGLKDEACSDSSLKKQFSNGATVRYEYFTEGGEKVFTDDVKARDC